MPEHPLRAARIYVDRECFGFPLPPLDELPDEVVDDLRFLIREVELPSADESDKRDMADDGDD